MATPTQMYSTIKQGYREPYIQSMERLRDAVDKQITNNDAISQLILQLAWDNANEDCKRAINLLPKENPSLNRLIDGTGNRSAVGKHAQTQASSRPSEKAYVTSSLEELESQYAWMFPPRSEERVKCSVAREIKCNITMHFVHLGVTHADYRGQICAMVSMPSPVTMPAKTCIVQFIPFKSCVPKTNPRTQRDRGFRSTGEPQVDWTQ
ncbi:hypothetical protein Nmel_005294, partial [Mimus melanotis]